MRQKEFFVIFEQFFFLLPPNNPTNQIFEKILERDGQNLLSFWTPDGYNFYFSFWAIFCSFTPPNDPKKQN